MKNSLNDLTDHLFMQIESLSGAKDNDVAIAVEKAEAISDLAMSVVKVRELQLKAAIARCDVIQDPGKRYLQDFSVGDD